MLLFGLSLTAPAAAQGQYPPPQYGQRPPQYGYGQPPPQYGYGQPPPQYGYGQPPPQYGQRPPQYGYGQPPPQYGYGQPAQRPAPQKKRTSDDPGNATAIFADLLTLRVHQYDIHGSDADATTTGFLFALDPDIVVTDDYLTRRSTWFMAIGGGSDGLEGQLESASRIGVRGYFGEDHGPFARAGLGFQFLGNNKIYRSQFELPAVDVGYQLLNEDMLFEVAAVGSLVLGGRFYLGDSAERRIDTEPAAGASVTLQIDPVRLYATGQRIFAKQTGPGTPIDQVQAQLCVEPFEDVIVCGHGGYHQGAVEYPASAGGGFHDAHVTYVGATIGYGVLINGTKGLFD